MKNIHYYETALDCLEESAKIYKEIDSPELYGDMLLDLTRYAFLAQKPEKATLYAEKAINYSLGNVVLLLTDSELEPSIATIEAIIQSKIVEHFALGSQCLETLELLYIPNKKDAATLEKKATEIKRLSKDNTLISSKQVVTLVEEIEAFIQKKRFITIVEHNAQEEARAIKEARNRQIALEKADKEKREKEKNQAEERERQLLLTKQAEEKLKRQIFLAEQEKQEKLRNLRIVAKRRAIIIRKILIVGVVVISIITITTTSFIKNRTQYESLDSKTFHERIADTPAKFISYFFIMV